MTSTVQMTTLLVLTVQLLEAWSVLQYALKSYYCKHVWCYQGYYSTVRLLLIDKSEP